MDEARIIRMLEKEPGKYIAKTSSQETAGDIAAMFRDAGVDVAIVAVHLTGVNMDPPASDRCGMALMVRRQSLQLSEEEASSRSTLYETDGRGSFSRRTLMDLENGNQHPLDLSAAVLGVLFKVLEWTPEEFTDATGVVLPGITDY